MIIYTPKANKVSVKPFHRVVGKMPDPPKVALRSKVLNRFAEREAGLAYIAHKRVFEGVRENFSQEKKVPPFFIP